MRLTLCGTVQLCVDGTDADNRVMPLPAKSLALLAYLSLEPGEHARDELRGLLWGESPEEKSNASLRQALKQLRDVVGDVINMEHHCVSVRGDIDSDIADFRRLIETNSERAADCDIPGFLGVLHIREAPAFQEWAERTRNTLLHDYRRTLSATARSAFARRDWGRALDLAHRWQRLDPCSDDAAHFHVEVLFLMGERDAALAAFRDFRARRAHEDDVAPGLAIRALVARIEQAPSRPTSVRATTARPLPLPSFNAGLIGREREWGALMQAWHALTSGRGGVAYIEGVTGIGKSRLADDLARFATAQKCTVLRGRAFYAGLDAPFGPVLDMLRGAVAAPGAVGTDGAWLAEVGRIVPEIRREFPSLPQPARAPTADGSLLHEGAAQLLRAVAEERRVLIVIDDLQWCDADSCNLVHYLVHRLQDAPILWCMTVTLGVVERDTPAARLARALRSAAAAARITLAPLSQEEVRQLIRALGHLTHADGARRLSKRVHEVTGGNALYVVELLKTLFVRGWLTVDSDTQAWRSSDSDSDSDDLLASELFPDVRTAITERVAALPSEQHALLLTIAATGSGCHTSLLSYVHGISRLRAAQVCDSLVERHLVREVESHYVCSHTVIASVVLETMGASRQREVHRMIAFALTDAAESVGRIVDPGAIARHAEAGGEHAMAHRYSLVASAQCVEQSAWDDALSWLDLATSCALTPEQICEADNATAALLGRPHWGATAPRKNVSRTMAERESIGRSDIDLLL